MQRPTNFSINKKSSPFLKILAGAIALFLLVFALNIFSASIKNIFYNFSSPLQTGFFEAGENSSGFFASLLNARFLYSQNQNLKQENQKLLAEVAELQSLSSANADQTEISLSCQNKNLKLLMAGVMGLDGQDMLSINKGSADGVQEGMPVVGGEKVLFGKVFKVYKNFSKVMLISNKDSVIDVQVIKPKEPELKAFSGSGDEIVGIGGTSTEQADPPETPVKKPKNVFGAVKGSGALSLYLDLVPVDDELVEGSTLVTSALDSCFPKDFLVGKVGKVSKNDQKAFQQAQVKPYFDLKNADNLFIVTNYKR